MKTSTVIPEVYKNADAIRRQGAERHRPEHDQLPYWKRAHHDWRVWVGLFFMLAATTIYVLSDDLSFFPRGQSRQPVSDARGK